MKKVSLVGLFLFSLFLVGCGNKEGDPSEQTNSIEQKEITTEQENVATDEESDFNKTDCMKGCEMIWDKKTSKEQMERDCTSLCEAGKAVDEKDPESCEKSEGIIKDSCYVNIANDTNNPELCKKVSDGMMKYGCYASLAETMKDPDICENIEDGLFKTTCIETAKGE